MRNESFERELRNISINGVTLADYVKENYQLRRTGVWIDDNVDKIDAKYDRHSYRCSACNKYADDFVGGTEDWWDVDKPDFCPNCGADMLFTTKKRKSMEQ